MSSRWNSLQLYFELPEGIKLLTTVRPLIFLIPTEIKLNSDYKEKKNNNKNK